jgi:hypothetical protein
VAAAADHRDCPPASEPAPPITGVTRSNPGWVANDGALRRTRLRESEAKQM